MYIHYNDKTLRVTGITTFVLVGTVFETPTLDILDVNIDKPLNEYIVDLTDNKITWVGKSDETIASDLERVKREQKALVKKDFKQASIEAVTLNSISYFGGNVSGTKLDSAKRLSEMGGNTTVTFFDTNNMPHKLSIIEAEDVILAIGTKYQQDFAKKQNLYNNITNAIDIIEVLSYNW